jgi:poly(3-hydroxybutyrate) depolymerase
LRLTQGKGEEGEPWAEKPIRMAGEGDCNPSWPMGETPTSGLSQIPFVCAALALGAAGRAAYAIAREMAGMAAAGPPQAASWTTDHAVALELEAVTLRDFSRSSRGAASLICAPLALHRASLADFAAGHSLVAGLSAAGLPRLYLTDWRPAGRDMCLRSLESYFADLNVIVDHVGPPVNLVGLCQGGWMAAAYAARFPAKIRKLVLAGAPIDIAAGTSPLSWLAETAPFEAFEEIVALGNGIVEGARMLPLWGGAEPDSAAVEATLQIRKRAAGPAFTAMEERYRAWTHTTIDLPGRFYLEIVRAIFKENSLARGALEVLGLPVKLSGLGMPIHLLVANEDDVVAPAQTLALRRHASRRPGGIGATVVSGNHLSLFMGRKVLGRHWPVIAGWLAREEGSHAIAR